MATRDSFPSDDPSPLFLSDYVEYTEDPRQPDILDPWDGTVISSRSLKRSILLATVAPIVLALLWVANPAALFANVTATQVDISAPRAGSGQSIAGRVVPTREEIAAAFRAASRNQAKNGQSSATALLQQFQIWAAEEEPRVEMTAASEAADQTGTRRPSGEALLKQFQTWAVSEDSGAQVAAAEPAPDDRAQIMQDAQVQDARAEDVQTARAQVRPMHQQIRRLRNARAEMRPEQHPRAKVRPVQHAQDRSAQNVEVSWPLRGMDWIN
jgi:hypothetical protein